MREEPKTNVELFVDLMEHSRYGALAQAFIVNAVSTMAERTAAMSDEQVAKLDAESAIHMQAWRGVAREIKAKMDAFYTQ